MTKQHVAASFALAMLMAGCGSLDIAAPRAPSASVPEVMPGFLAGYLAADQRPGSLSLLPPPPAPGSLDQARDDAAARAALALRGGPRWDQAKIDAELYFPAAADTFSCALDLKISEAETPRLYVLLRRTLVDAGMSVDPTKAKYRRARPYQVNGQPNCTPEVDAELRKDFSYPSGHTALGWGWALILAELAPERADAILARGRAYGDSRRICNVHWLSDIEEGRVMGSAAVARLHADPGFRADLEAARAEIAAARAKGSHPAIDCAAEAARLAAG